MKWKTLKNLFVVLAFSPFFSNSQNLVPNPSFETYTSCPSNADQLSNASPWFKPTTGTPDYYNACAPMASYFNVPVTVVGNCPANSGLGIAGIVLMDDMSGTQIYREYSAVKLTTPLINNKKYFVTYYVRLADSARYASNQVNIYFGDSIYKTIYDTINVTPQIQNPLSNFVTNKNVWTKLRGSFIATGNENFLYIGNFKHPFNGDTLFVNGGDKSSYNFPYYFLDDICVTDDSLYSETWVTSLKESEKKHLNFYPNPVKDKLFIENFENESTFKLFNLQGEEMEMLQKHNYIDLSKLKEGIYFLKCIAPSNKTYNYKLIKE